MTVVFDTSTLTPAIIPASDSRRLIDRLVTAGTALCISQPIFDVVHERDPVMAPLHTVRVFRYLDDLDAFVVTETYQDIADTLGLSEWTPVVWIGRLFTLDNDFGEHWFDNWELREKKGLSEDYLLVDPERFKDGRDGPCHSAEFRKRFWTDVLKSLELSFDLICDEARQFNEQSRKRLEEHPDVFQQDLIPDLEERIDRLRVKYWGEPSTRKTR